MDVAREVDRIELWSSNQTTEVHWLGLRGAHVLDFVMPLCAT
jgi:hypothetical protein